MCSLWLYYKQRERWFSFLRSPQSFLLILISETIFILLLKRSLRRRTLTWAESRQDMVRWILGYPTEDTLYQNKSLCTQNTFPQFFFLSRPQVLMFVVVSGLVLLLTSSFIQGRMYRDTDAPNMIPCSHNAKSVLNDKRTTQLKGWSKSQVVVRIQRKYIQNTSYPRENMQACSCNWFIRLEVVSFNNMTVLCWNRSFRSQNPRGGYLSYVCWNYVTVMW